MMTYINSPEELAAFADERGCRPNWHEPDEQGLSHVVLDGNKLDNAFGAEKSSDYLRFARAADQRLVIIDEIGQPVAIVNVANLLAWASKPFRQGRSRR
jgi:hypothetical protein